jgi:hypothetical protein
VPRRKIQPGLLSAPDAADLNARLEWLERRAVVAATGGILLTEGPGGTVVRQAAASAPAPAFSGARVQAASGQSIPNSTETIISWATYSTGYDMGGYFSSGSPTLLTAPEDGYYLAQLQIGWAANATGFRRIQIFTSQSPDTVVAVMSPPCSLSSPTTQTGSAPLFLTAGFNIFANVFQTSGSSLSIGGVLSLSRLR